MGELSHEKSLINAPRKEPVLRRSFKAGSAAGAVKAVGTQQEF